LLLVLFIKVVTIAAENSILFLSWLFLSFTAKGGKKKNKEKKRKWRYEKK